MVSCGGDSIIHDAKTDAQRDALFKEMRTGKQKSPYRFDR